jgi:hypothetical protein
MFTVRRRTQRVSGECGVESDASGQDGRRRPNAHPAEHVERTRMQIAGNNQSRYRSPGSANEPVAFASSRFSRTGRLASFSRLCRHLSETQAHRQECRATTGTRRYWEEEFHLSFREAVTKLKPCSHATRWFPYCFRRSPGRSQHNEFSSCAQEHTWVPHASFLRSVRVLVWSLLLAVIPSERSDEESLFVFLACLRSGLPLSGSLARMTT